MYAEGLQDISNLEVILKQLILRLYPFIWYNLQVPIQSVFVNMTQLPILSRLCGETQAPEQEAVGEETPGACVEK